MERLLRCTADSIGYANVVCPLVGQDWLSMDCSESRVCVCVIIIYISTHFKIISLFRMAKVNISLFAKAQKYHWCDDAGQERFVCSARPTPKPTRRPTTPKPLQNPYRTLTKPLQNAYSRNMRFLRQPVERTSILWPRGLVLMCAGTPGHTGAAPRVCLDPSLRSS